MTIFEWIGLLGEDANDCMLNQHCDFSDLSNNGLNLISAIFTGIFSIFEVPLRFVIDLSLAVMYILNHLWQIIVYLIAPWNCLVQFLTGIVQSWLTPQTLDLPFVINTSLVSLLNSIPGVATLELCLVAAFWWLVFQKTLKTLKY